MQEIAILKEQPQGEAYYKIVHCSIDQTALQNLYASRCMHSTSTVNVRDWILHCFFAWINCSQVRGLDIVNVCTLSIELTLID